LVSVSFSIFFLKEKLNGLQKCALGLATLGVVQLSLQGSHFPFISFALAFTFATYGLTRKRIPVEPLVASTIETLFLTIPAVLFWVMPIMSGRSDPPPLKQFLLLILGGVFTGLPLLWFAKAVKKVPLSTIGFFQYISPILQFSLAVFLFKEPFTEVHFRSFACIWIGLAFYIYDLGKKSGLFQTWSLNRWSYAARRS
jgi:chloramphenicol-sensitive protein RarD